MYVTITLRLSERCCCSYIGLFIGLMVSITVSGFKVIFQPGHMLEYAYFSSKFNPLYVYRHCGYQKKSVEAEPRYRLKYTKHSNICSNI